LRNGIGERYRNLNTLQGFNKDDLKNALGFCLIEHNKIYLQKMIGVLPHDYLNDEDFYFRYYLAYCPDCIEKGFHSLFHQFKFIHECPYHEIPLIRNCPKCNQKIPYSLQEFPKKQSEMYLTDAFRCICGYSLFNCSDPQTYFSNWNVTPLSNLKCNKIKLWINLNDQQITRLKRIYFFTKVDFDHYENILEYLLTVVDPNNVTSEKGIHQFVTSAKYINSIRGEKEQELKDRYTRKDFPGINQYYIDQYKFEAYQKEMHRSFSSTVGALARHLRKTIFKKHKTCIKRFLKMEKKGTLEPICPYAYSYIFWRKFAQNYYKYCDVDNHGYPQRLNLRDIEFPSSLETSFLKSIYRYLERKYRKACCDQTTEGHAATKWLLNRSLLHLELSNYKNWLRVSPYYVKRYLVANLPPFHYELLPFSFSIFAIDSNEPFEFHWWDSKDSAENYNLGFECPYPTRKNRREPERKERIKKIIEYKRKYHL
jgi:hypothetical protein